MKKFLFLITFLIATPAYAQVGNITVGQASPDVPVQVSEFNSLPNTATGTDTVLFNATSTFATTTATTTLPTVATTTEVSEKISIIPGGISLKISSKVPIAQAPKKIASTRQIKTESDGLFDLIYTGFEEFVFKVFGI